MTAHPRTVAIVGGSAAGLAVATGLRDEGYDGTILMLDAEDGLPYDRPPLSKRLLRTADDRPAIALTTREELTTLDIETLTGVRAVGLNPSARQLMLADGTAIDWDACVIATGASPIRLPGNALVLRGFEDALRISRALRGANHVVIVGAGVLGCELAALARAQGASVEVTDIEAGAMIARVGPTVSDRLVSLHRDNGVAFRFGTSVEGIEGDLDTGFRVSFGDGTATEADLVLVAVGCRPAVDWLDGSGLSLDNGVVCDAFCEAATGIHAVGDVANWINPRFGRRMRIEHRTNATEQGLFVAAAIMGAREPFDPIPFFWTDQYEARIQVHGMIERSMRVDVLPREDNGGFLALYSRADRVEGVLGWSMARAARRARRFIGSDREAALTELAEPC